MTPTIGVGLNGAWGTSLKDAFNQAKKEAWDDPNKHWSVSASVAKPRYEYTADEHAASGGLKDLQAQREQIDEASGTPSNPKADLRQGGSAHIPNTAEEIRAYCERNKYTGELNGYLKGAGQSIDPIANFNDAADSFKNGSILGVALGVLGMIPGGSEVKLVGKEILQVGGNILKPGTLKVLGMTKEEGRNAMHALKEYIGVRHDSHGIIMKDGNYFNKAGELLGNLKDFLQ